MKRPTRLPERLHPAGAPGSVRATRVPPESVSRWPGRGCPRSRSIWTGRKRQDLLVLVVDAEHRVVIDDGLDVVERRLRGEAEVIAGLFRVGPVPAAVATCTKVLGDDLTPVGRSQFHQADPLSAPAPDDRPSVSCSNVARPLRLAGQSHQVVAAQIARS